MPRDEERRDEALSTIRLSDHELIGLADLATRTTIWSTSAGPPYDATKEEREEYEAKEEARRLDDAKQRADALLELRAWVESRETDAYLRGVDATISEEARSRVNARTITLLFVIAAVVAMPILAIWLNIDPERFGSYIAPVTAIAGTVVGYWFSSAGGAGAGRAR
jgi:hypothetical protein